MRGKVRKEHILLAGIVLALVIALGQLGMLIYRTYRNSEEVNDYVELSFNEDDHVNVQVKVDGKKITPTEEKYYRVKKGKELIIQCIIEKGYGIKSFMMEDTEEKLKEMQNDSLSIKLEKNTNYTIRTGKIYGVKIHSTGDGYTKISNEEQNTERDIEWNYFEGDIFAINFNAEKYSYIKKITIDDKVCYQHIDNLEYKTSYNLEYNQNGRHSIQIEYEKITYKVQMEKNDAVDIWINDEKIDSKILNAGSVVNIKIRANNKETYIRNVMINTKESLNNDTLNKDYSFNLEELNEDIGIHVNISKIKTIYNSPNDVFEIFEGGNKLDNYKVINENGEVRYFFNKEKHLIIKVNDKFKNILQANFNLAKEGIIKVSNNCVIDDFLLSPINGAPVRYAYPIHIIFDTVAPLPPTYTLTHPSLTQTTLATTIHDDGESGIESVQFGTKADYDAKLSADQTKEKYHTEVANTSGTSYAITLNHKDLKEEEFYIWATDNAGNRSDVTKIDLTGPEVKVDTKAGWSNKDVTIQGSAADKENKVGRIYYSTNKEAAESHFKDLKGSQNVTEATVNNDGSFEIKTTAEKTGIATYYIWAYDNLGNKSKKIEVFEAKVDKKPPVLALKKKLPDQTWANTAVRIEFTAMDKEDADYSGIDEVYFYRDNETTNVITLEVNKDENQSYVIETPKDKDGKAIAWQGHYYIYATDKAGNRSEVLSIEINIDVDAPKPESIDIKGTDASKVNQTAFGIFYNKSIKVMVQAADAYDKGDGRQTVSSGTKEISLLCDGKEIQKKQVEETSEVVSFQLNPTMQDEKVIQGNFSIVCYDNAGNVSEQISINKINNSCPDFICIEAENPTIHVDCPAHVYVDANANQWYGEHQEIQVKIEDKRSGLGSVKVLLNGMELNRQIDGKEIAPIATDKKTEEAAFTIDSQHNGDSQDGKYVLEISVLDNAGNENSFSKTIYVDQQEPQIKKFTFNTVGTGNEMNQQENNISYGYFLNEKTKVTITAEDASPSSGIKEIEYYLMDYSKSDKGTKSESRRIQTDADGNASFEINKRFKGNIFAKAYDQVQHTKTEFSHPQGIIVDSNSKDSKDNQISFTPPESKGKGADHNLLYDKDVDVTVDLINEYKGIKTIEWEAIDVGNEDKKQGGKVEVSSDGNLSGKHENFEVKKRDSNLATHVQGKLHITGNNNGIRLHVVLTDRSGEKKENEMFLSIDKSKPEVGISFDNQHASTYYNQDRTATITVKDKNFDEKRISMYLNNTNGEVPKLSAWRRQKDGETYAATLNFNKDGLYALNLSVEDMAGNKSNTVSAESFTIDKTKPVIDVKLNQVQEKTGDIRYYNQPVQARIEIEEANFDINKVEVQGKGNLRGKEISFPKAYYTKSTKIGHTLGLDFQEEGEYTLSIRCTDEAGNSSESEMSYHFVIDKSCPVIEIQGVEDSKAYNGVVIPKVKVTDMNYKGADTKVSLSNGKGEKVACKPVMDKVEDGFCFTLDCFPKEKEYDQVYGIEVTSNDLAGNQSSKKIYFSVNRFGSTYYFNDALQQASGKYLNKEFDVVITETNVNAIDPSHSLLRMICNDTVTDLVPGHDYDVENGGGDGGWYTYTYRISRDLFKEDGTYQFNLFTKDEAGNINENEAKSKKALVWFGVDRTAPRVVPINISNGGTYNETSRQVSFRVEDNLVLNSAKVFVNDSPVEFTQEGDRFTFNMGSSNKAQSIRLVATDLAGNETEHKVSDLYITTNLLVRVIHGKVLFMVGIIVLCVSAAAAMIAFFVYRKKRAKNLVQ